MLKVISKNGKDYLQSNIVKINNEYIDATEFFITLELCKETILKKLNQANKTNFTYLGSGQYGANIQYKLNRFSGSYFSPSFLTGYLKNPATTLIGDLFEEEKTDATYVGSTFHKILEEYYKLPSKERDRSRIWDLRNELADPETDLERLDGFLEGFIRSKDYLNRKPLDDTQLDCKTEHRGRGFLYVPSINYNTPCKVAYVIDRLDNRNGDYYIIDYKTGRPRKEAPTFDGYLLQMLLYKWGAENEFDCTISGGYLMMPASKESFISLDFSRENELKAAEIIEDFYTRLQKDNSRRVYPFTNQGFFSTDGLKRFRNTMNDQSIQMAKIPLEIMIGDTKDSVL